MITEPFTAFTTKIPRLLKLQLTTWHLDREGQVQHVSAEIEADSLTERPREVDQMMRNGFDIFRDKKTEFVPSHRIVSIEIEDRTG